MLIIFLVEVAAEIVLFVFKPLVRADALHHNKSTLKKLVQDLQFAYKFHK